MRLIQMTLALVVLALALIVAVAAVVWKVNKPSSRPSSNVVLPGTKNPDEEKVAELLNHFNAEMRSCRLATWMIHRLALMVEMAGDLPCGTAVKYLPFHLIPKNIPGTTAHVRASVEATLRDMYVTAESRSKCKADGSIDTNGIASNIRALVKYCLTDSRLNASYGWTAPIALPDVIF